MPRLILSTTTLVAAALFAGCQSQNPDASAQKPATVSPSKTDATANQTSSDARIAELQRAADAARTGIPMSPHDKPGFVTKVDDGRLWVFKKDAKELAEFAKHGELVKSVTRIGVGPNRMTVRAADAATIDAYLAAEPKTVNAPVAVAPALPSSPHDKPGFVTKVDDGRLWVFKKDAKELAEFTKHGELVKSVTRIGVGPNRMTVRAADSATIDAYLAAEPKTVNVAAPAAADPYARSGFVTKLKDGRLWVFKEGAKELAEFEKHGELVKSVTRVAAGPNRVTLRSGDAATIDAYLAAVN